MNNPPPPEIFTRGSVTIVCPGPDYENLFESILGNLGVSVAFAQSLESPLLVVDMQHVNLIGSAFLSQMISSTKRLPAGQGGSRCATLDHSVAPRSKFRRLHTLLEIYADLETALDAFSKPKPEPISPRRP